NSDINIRNFEVLSSRGFLLTDYLPDVTGFNQLFRPGEACETYSDAEELVNKIHFYRSNPSFTLKIAQRGHELFSKALTPDRALDKFKSTMFYGHADAMLPPDSRCHGSGGHQFWRRLEAYEDVQELHRKRLFVRVLVRDGVDWFHHEDFLDLPRLSLDYASVGSSQGVQTDEATWDYVISP